MLEKETDHLIILTVGGRKFKIPSVSVTSVIRDSSFRDFQSVNNSEERITLGDLICISETPPMWLAAGGFDTSYPISSKIMHKWLNLCMDHFLISFFSSFSLPTKLLSLSEFRIFMFPLQRMTCLKAYLKGSMSILCVISICTAWIPMQVNISQNIQLHFYIAWWWRSQIYQYYHVWKVELQTICELEGHPSFDILSSLQYRTHLNRKLLTA